MASSQGLGLPRLAVSILILLTPPVAFAALQLLVKRRRYGGGAQASGAERSSRTFALVFTAVPVAVFALFSLTHTDIKLNWTGPAWIALVPLLAEEWAAPAEARSRIEAFLARTWRPTLTALVPLYGLALHYHALGLPGVGYPQSTQVFGWEDLGAKVERIEDEVEEQEGAEPLVMGLDKYNITSALAFYRSRANRHCADAHARSEGVQGTVGRHLIGKPDLMYRYWSDDELSRGRTVILVAEDRDALADQEVEEHFESMSGFASLVARHNGKAAGRYHLRVGYGFRPESELGPSP
jgi:dolichol-phosphate mannosyltransferase